MNLNNERVTAIVSLFLLVTGLVLVFGLKLLEQVTGEWNNIYWGMIFIFLSFLFPTFRFMVIKRTNKEVESDSIQN
ncbi:MAG: hypothetical protein ACTSQE_11475 [Candidatus Heimdallarchaeaceae archaeon]